MVSITICNLALSECHAPAIVDIAENTTEAKLCARFYPQCLKLLLERYEWSFATHIAALAQLSDNPRSGEWPFAYALPSDLATAKRLVPPADGNASGGSYWSSPWPFVRAICNLSAFIVEAGVLYTHVADAILEYSLNDISEGVMPALFADALTYSLASRIAVPLMNDSKTKGELLQQSEIAAQRAIADDFNRQPERQQQSRDEVGFVRNG